MGLLWKAAGPLAVAAAGVAGLAVAALTAGAPAPVAAEGRVDAVRMHEGYGYVPHDPDAFLILAQGMTALPERELAQMAGFADALAAALDERSPEELAGRIGDLLAAVDLAYADARRMRPVAPEYDAEALRRITDRIGYDARGLTDG